METSSDNQYNDGMNEQPARPEFLKILCILSFVASGLMILIYGIGTFCLGISEEMIGNAWEKVTESNPQFANMDAVEFFHAVGMLCVYGLIANVFSLVGVIMMWRLEKIGFFIYAIAEISTNFLSLDIKGSEGTSSMGGMIFSTVIDLVFIVMYFLNLKHMNKKNNNTFIQSGS